MEGTSTPPQAEAVSEAGGDHPTHVATQKYLKGARVEDPSNYYQGEYGH